MTETTPAAPARTKAKERLIVALDVDHTEAARRLVDELREFTGAFKVGLQLFTADGPKFVRELCDSGRRVFLDLKFHDIPNTVAKAGVEAARLGVWMFNVHATGGNEMMRRVVYEVGEACENESIRRPKIIGVTVLTSSSDDTLRDIGIEASVGDHVVRLARLSKEAGLDGVVASAHEAENIRRECGNEFIIVTPGVRPNDDTNDDQKRVMTPKDAISAGADYLVVGRPITMATDRAAAAAKILKDISEEIDE
jgi:orotidine-5'-phosphate decarboxylase